MNAPIKQTVKISRSKTDEKKNTNSLGITAGVTGNFGVVAVSTSISTSFQQEIMKSETYKKEETHNVICVERTNKGPMVVAYHFALVNGAPRVTQRTKEHRCHYFAEDEKQIAPRCEPSQCLGAYCQTCADDTPLKPVKGFGYTSSESISLQN